MAAARQREDTLPLRGVIGRPKRRERAAPFLSTTARATVDLAPGSVPSPPFVDLIGSNVKAHAGLAYLRIHYSDGSRGVLVVSCNFVGTPPTVFEGITASKNFVDYFMRVDGGFTLFHITASEDD